MKVFVVTYFANLVWIMIMWLAQELDKSLPARHSIIPGTNQKFLHMEDFYTCSWGDCGPLSMVQFAFVTVAVAGKISGIQWAVFVVLAVVLGLGFLAMCLGKNHKPDQGYPAVGKVSVHGILHLPHFGVSVAMAAFVLWHIFIARDLPWGWVQYIFWVGGVMWLVTFVMDNVTGHFDPLKLDLHDPDPEDERRKNLEACC